MAVANSPIKFDNSQLMRLEKAFGDIRIAIDRLNVSLERISAAMEEMEAADGPS